MASNISQLLRLSSARIPEFLARVIYIAQPNPAWSEKGDLDGNPEDQSQ
jgi:hypothetical protein